MVTPYNALTPRNRQETEAQPLLRTRRLVPVTPVLSAITLATPIDKRMLSFERLWVANTGGAATYSLHIVNASEAADPENAVAYNVAVPANTTLEIIGLSGMVLAPGQSLIATSTGAVNMFGIGWDIIGEAQ